MSWRKAGRWKRSCVEDCLNFLLLYVVICSIMRRNTAAVGLAAIMSLLFAMGCKTKPDHHRYTIVVVGSSTAEGYGIKPKDSCWVNRFAYSLGPEVAVHNISRSGYSTYEVMPTGTSKEGRPAPDEQRNITKALSFHPDAIIINLPTNDAAAGYSLEEQQANFRTIIQTATDKHILVWVTTTQPRTNTFGHPRNTLPQMRDWLLATYGDKVINFWEPFANPDNTINKQYDQDGIHLNIPGHRILFERVAAKHIMDTVLYYHNIQTTKSGSK
ncbi:SGNH/GDSL hydrolase family protein [Chitinophaga agrisoli]|uniref:SGNH/GDSL hydrolase family protein n=2 Tax=Chitinophaga agrisoli TaxID=2607653 RepID=A0A5B2VXI8_9BACT|nr:SGNH/GDSL hydrolase family protein [Chitinophaga agrisoli]